MFKRTPASFLARYDDMCLRVSRQVIAEYSTSFSLATKLLSGPMRRDISNLYAVVRVADEIVDGPAHEAREEDVGKLLDAYEQAVLTAPAQRFHTDPILHAYAMSARRCGFRAEHMQAFFASMRKDLGLREYTSGEFDDYVYGSAEVIGLMCLDVFLADHPLPAAERAVAENGARALGAAFQKINFLRDLREDSEDLGRSYFPGVTPSAVDDETKNRLVADIRADLATAQATMHLLPAQARCGVSAAARLFRELTDRIDEAPAHELTRRRIRVPAGVKLRLTARSILDALPPSLSLKD